MTFGMRFDWRGGMNVTDGHLNIYATAQDESLMKGIALGSPDAMEVLMDRYLPMVSRISYRILCDIPESGEVARDVFVEVWKTARLYDFRTSVSVWICRIVYRLCRLHLLKLRILDMISGHQSVYETSAPAPISPEEDFNTKETWGIYCRAARFLSTKEIAAFVFIELEEMPVADVSRIMRMNSGSVRENLLAARGKIKEELKKYGKVI